MCEFELLKKWNSYVENRDSYTRKERATIRKKLKQEFQNNDSRVFI